MKLTQSLQADQVRHLQPREALMLPGTSTLRDAIDLMQKNKTGCVMIMNEQGRAAGIFTERDVLHKIVGSGTDLRTPMKDIMSTPLYAVGPADPATHAIRMLHARRLRHVPVLGDAGELVGVVSIRRVLEYLVDHFPQAVYNSPPASRATPTRREGA